MPGVLCVSRQHACVLVKEPPQVLKHIACLQVYQLALLLWPHRLELLPMRGVLSLQDPQESQVS